MWRLLLGTTGVKSLVQGLNAAATAGFEPRTVSLHWTRQEPGRNMFFLWLARDTSVWHFSWRDWAPCRRPDLECSFPGKPISRVHSIQLCCADGLPHHMCIEDIRSWLTTRVRLTDQSWLPRWMQIGYTSRERCPSSPAQEKKYMWETVWLEINHMRKRWRCRQSNFLIVAMVRGHRKSSQKPSETNKISFPWTPLPPPETNKSSHFRL